MTKPHEAERLTKSWADKLYGMGAATWSQTFSFPGLLEPQVGSLRIYNDTGQSLSVILVRVSVGTPSGGSSVLAALLQEGESVCEVSVPPGANSTPTVPDPVIVIAPGEYITAEVIQPGATAASDLTLQVTAITS